MKKILFVVIMLFFISACSFNNGKTSPVEVFTITYDLDGGVNNIDNPITYQSNEGFTLNEPTKEGYDFLGWTFNDITTPKKVVSIYAGSKDYSFKANWVGKSYLITFDSDGGNNVPSINQAYLSEVEAPQNPLKTGYNFLGWYKNETPISFPLIMPFDGLELKAKWEVKEYQISYELQEGQCDSLKNSYNILSEDYILPTPTRSGFQFLGWYSNGEKITKIEKGTTGDLTIIANWINMSNNITYNHSYDNELVLILTDGTKTPLVMGEKITSSDYLASAGRATIKKDFMQKFTNGSYIFLCVIDGEDELFYVEVTNNPYVEIERAVYDGTEDNEEYFNKTFSINGKTYDYYIEDEDELYALLEYTSLVDGPINKKATTEHPYGEITSYCFIQDDYLEIFKIDTMKLLKNMYSQIGLPMQPLFSYTQNDNVIGIKLVYDGVLNQITSDTPLVEYDEKQGMILSSTRTLDYDDFKINNYSKTELIETIYELENLSYGVKPIFNGSSEAYEVYLEAKKILIEINDDTMSDYDKVENIYAYLALNVTYDDYVLSSSLKVGEYTAFTSYGAIIKKLAVCDGIASAFKLMCLIEGIEAIEVFGSVSTGGHAWNKVCIDGIWSCIDATWATASISGKVYVNTSYLFSTESYFIETGHIENGGLEEPYVGKIATGDISYFEYRKINNKYDLYVTSIEELKAVINYGRSNNLGALQIVYDAAMDFTYALSYANSGGSISYAKVSNTIYLLY